MRKILTFPLSIAAFLLLFIASPAANPAQASARLEETDGQYVRIILQHRAWGGDVEWRNETRGEGAIEEVPFDVYFDAAEKTLNKKAPAGNGKVYIPEMPVPGGFVEFYFRGVRPGAVDLHIICASSDRDAPLVDASFSIVVLPDLKIDVLESSEKYDWPDTASSISVLDELYRQGHEAFMAEDHKRAFDCFFQGAVSGDYAGASTGVAPAPAAKGKDGKVFTAEDFNYIPGFSVNPDKELKKAFLCPGYEDVIRGFGKPDSQSEDGLGLILDYEFGEITLRLADGKPDTFWLLITEEELEGPRGIRVGDPFEKVLNSFKNALGALPATLPEDEFQVELYSEGAQPGPAYTGMASTDSESGQVTNLYYWNGNMRGSTAVSVNFIIEDGVVASIMWRIDERA